MGYQLSGINVKAFMSRQKILICRYGNLELVALFSPDGQLVYRLYYGDADHPYDAIDFMNVESAVLKFNQLAKD